MELWLGSSRGATYLNSRKVVGVWDGDALFSPPL